MQSGLNDISFLKESMIAILKKLDILHFESTGPSTTVFGILQQVPAESGCGKDKEQGNNLHFESTGPSTTVFGILQQVPAESGCGEDKEQGTQMSDGLPPTTSMNSMPPLIELPVLNDENLEGGLFHEEHYFELKNLPSPQGKAWSVVLCSKNDALFWYCYKESRQPFCSWEEFRILLVMQGYSIKKKRKKKILKP